MNRPTVTPDAIVTTENGADSVRRSAATVGSIVALSRNYALSVADPRMAMQEKRADKEERIKYGDE